jgi:hypothetical protein
MQGFMSLLLPLNKVKLKENKTYIVYICFVLGRAEVNIRPWETTLNNIQEGNKNVKWKDRIAYAFWKGNPTVSYIRKELVKCNASEEHNVRIYDVVSS